MSIDFQHRGQRYAANYRLGGKKVFSKEAASRKGLNKKKSFRKESRIFF
jgi:hypothetical protein